MNDWAIADELSDRIVDLIDVRLEEMRRRKDIQPLQLLAGQLLGLMATFRTMPPFGHPEKLRALIVAVEECLDDMVKAKA